jgi:predicted HicB family RNase H-like nuclease
METNTKPRRVRGTNLYLDPALVNEARKIASKREQSLSRFIEKILRRQVAAAQGGAK